MRARVAYCTLLLSLFSSARGLCINLKASASYGVCRACVKAAILPLLREVLALHPKNFQTEREWGLLYL